MSKIETNIKMSLNQINLQKWIEKGNAIPTCINDGCENKVAIRHWSAQGDPSLKTECSRCSDARKKNKKISGDFQDFQEYFRARIFSA